MGNMDCEKAKQLLHPYLDDYLSRVEKEGLQSHLFRCSECRLELLRMERALLIVEELGVAKAPRGFAESVMVEIRKEAGTQKRFGDLLYITSLASVFLSMAVVYRSGVSFFENIAGEGVLDLGLGDGGYTILDGLLTALSNLEAGLVLGLCLVFISSAFFVLRLLSLLPGRPAYYSQR